MHEVDVFGERLAQGLGHRLDPPVGDQPPPDLGLDLLLQLLDARLELVALEALLEGGHVAADFLASGIHELLEHAVEIEVPQRAVEVVRAADWAARLHAGVPADGLAGKGPHHRLVGVHQRPIQHLGELLRRQLVHRAAGTTLLLLAGLHLAPLVALAVTVDGELGASK